MSTSEPAGLIERVTRAWVGFVVRFALPLIVLVTLTLIPSGWYAATHLGIDTSTADMIAEHLPWRRAFSEYRDAFPQLDHTLVAVIDAPDADHADDARDAFYLAMQGRPDLFSEVFAPGSDPFFRRNALLYQTDSELIELADRLAQMQPFLARVARDTSTAGLFDVLSDALTVEAIDIDVGPVITNIAEVVESVLAGQPTALSWQALMGGAADLPARRVVVLRPELDFARLHPARAAINAVREQEQLISAALPSAVQIRLTGPVALEYEEMASVSAGARTAGLLASGLVLIILYFALRSAALVFGALVTLVTGLIFTATFAAVAIGSLNLISIAFAILYIGLGIDFAIHFCLRYREACADTDDRKTALINSAGDVGSSLVLCAVTTSIGFFAFFPTTFKGVSELGIISGTGMYISLLVTLTLLPAILSVLPMPAPVPVRTTLVNRLQQLSAQRWLLPVAATVVAAALLIIPAVSFDSDPLNLRDPDSESVATFRDLLDDARYSPRTLSIIASDASATDAARTTVAELSSVSSVTTVDDFVPAGQDEKLALVEEIAWLVGPDLQPANSLSPSLQRDRVAIAKLLVALEGRGDAAARLQRALAALDNNNLIKLNKMLVGTLPGRLGALNAALGAEPVSLATLPDALRSRWVTSDGRQRIELRTDRTPAEFVEDVRRVLPDATGLPVVQWEAGRAVVGAFKQAFVTALVLITVILLLLLRNWQQVLVVLLPMAAASALTVAAMVMTGQPFNFANVIALPLLLGVGVDNGIHMVHRWRSTGARLLQSSTTRAIWFSALTTIASFGNLAFSSHPGSASMGRVLTIGMLFTTLSTIVLIPALLTRLSR